MTAPFVVFSLPRSRSAWLSHYLSYGTKRVGHDISIECKTIDDFISSFANGMAGTVETGAVMAWQVIKARLPKVKFVVLRRPLGQVYDSLAKFNIVPQPGELEAREELLDLVGNLPGSQMIYSRHLSDPECAAWIFEYCLRLPFDQTWFDQLTRLNIQVDMQARIQQLYNNHQQLEALKASVVLASRELSPCPLFQ